MPAPINILRIVEAILPADSDIRMREQKVEQIHKFAFFICPPVPFRISCAHKGNADGIGATPADADAVNVTCGVALHATTCPCFNIEVEPKYAGFYICKTCAKNGNCVIESWTNYEVPSRLVGVGATGEVALSTAQVREDECPKFPLPDDRGRCECRDNLDTRFSRELRAPPLKYSPLPRKRPHCKVAEGYD